MRAQITTNNDDNVRQPPNADPNNLTRPNNDADMGTSNGDEDMGVAPEDMAMPNNTTPSCTPECGANEECSNGECVPACSPACEAPAVCTANGCQIPDCTQAGDECDLDRPTQGDFSCVDIGEPTGLCLTSCTETYTADICEQDEYCWPFGGMDVCLPDLCDTNDDCDGGAGTCTDWDNGFSICVQNGSLAEGATCDPMNNECAVGLVCRETGPSSGVCSKLCDPFAASPGCGVGEFCGEPFTTREWICSDELDQTAPNDPWVECFDPGLICDDATRCLDLGSINGCMKYCRPGESDCAGVSTANGPTTCNAFSFPGQRAIGLCDGACTSNADCGGVDVVCVDQVCRLACTPGQEVQDCCGGQTPCNWTCDPDTQLCI